MPRCPSCHSRLPLRKVILASSPACPRCHRELEPQRWVLYVSTLVALATAQGVGYLAERWGFNLGVRFIVSVVCGLAIWPLVYVLLARYRLKDSPLSILSTPDASRRDDAPRGH
jgi:uncharacterized paraquat-inducible protein A